MLKFALLSTWLFLTALCSPLLAAGSAMDLQLHKAAAAGDAVTIRTLLAKGAHIEARDGSGATAVTPNPCAAPAAWSVVALPPRLLP